MNDLLEILQADITAILTATPELADAVVLADNEGDIEAKVARALAAIQGGPTAKRGLAVVVLLPEVTETEQNLPGPPLLVRCEIRTIEHVLVNRGTGGTGLRSSQAALATLAALHHHSIGPNILFAENDALTPVEVKPGHVSHAVTLFHRANGLQGPGKCSAVTVSEEDDVITLACATEVAAIYFTTDGTYPTPTNGALYTAPIEGATVGLTYRCAAYKDGLNPGDCTEFVTVLPENTILDGGIALTDADGSFITDD
jgi:hypothetical protein